MSGWSLKVKVIPFDRVGMVFYWCSIITLFLRDIQLVTIP